jgi:hypothetical protein
MNLQNLLFNQTLKFAIRKDYIPVIVKLWESPSRAGGLPMIINITVLFLFAGGREERVASELAAVARLRRANTLLEQKSLRDSAQLRPVKCNKLNDSRIRRKTI